jgi:CHAT domain-containing protein
MRRILAWFAFGIFLAGIGALLPPVSAQQTLEAPSQTASPFEKGRLGAELRDLTEQSITTLGLTQAQAVLVVLPVAGGPAERAGIGPGDVIVELEGSAVGSVNEFAAAIQSFGAGRTVTLDVLRGKQHLTLRATLGKTTDSDAAGPSEPSALDRRVATLEAILLIFNRETFPQEWAHLQDALGATYRGRRTGDRADNLKKAIAAYEAALTVFTREAFPREWAATQNNLDFVYRGEDLRKAMEFFNVVVRLQNQDLEETIAVAQKGLELEREIGQWPSELTMPREEARARVLQVLGLAYSNLPSGDRAANLERAIAAYERALQSLTREKPGANWAHLQNLLAIAYENRIRGERADNLEKAIEAQQAALTIFTPEAFPREWAIAQNGLATAYQARIHGNRADNLDRAIAIYEAALTVLTREAPSEWALVQHNLGAAYADRINGNRADNLEKTIAAYEAALTVRTREILPREWAETQNNLALAYHGRIRGERGNNLEKSIAGYEAALTVLTPEALPTMWAQVQSNRANAYVDRIPGERADNLEKAIAAYEAAITVLTRQGSPTMVAHLQTNLANAYAARVRGDRSDNLEKAIATSERALTVQTREAQPHEWANTQNNLGIVYLDRIRGDRADNLEKAVAYLNAALTVRTREALPSEWAAVQHNLGLAYSRRILRDRADNMEKAIDAYQSALAVRTSEALPREWAETQNNLGLIYLDRIRGDRADNLEKAIAYLGAALTLKTREALPHQWADTQHNLGIAYKDRIHGDRSANLEKAIAAARAALTVRTREARPRDHLLTARLLGQNLLEAREWHKAGLAYASARDTFLLLFGQGINDVEARDLIAEAGYMFAQAAFAAAERGEVQAALALASEGRGRLMAVALKQQGLDLPADKRPRLDELRAAIRGEQRAVEATQGTERAAAVEKLARLRQELLGFVKGATTAEGRRGSVRDSAHAILPNGGAIVVPILTHVGTKILIVTSGVRSHDRSTQGEVANEPSVFAPALPSEASRPSITVLNLPELTLGKLVDTVVRPNGKIDWLLAYHINYLQGAEQDRLWPQWLAAIDNLGPELWRLFGARVDAALKERGVKRGARLVWLPPGALGILPLGLAQDPVSKRRFADSYEVVYAPSLEALAMAQKQIAKRKLATLAAIINPTEDLFGTEKEGKVVASHFPATARTILERDAATPDAVLAALKGKTHWHFASHGTFSWDDARLSALIMHGNERLSVGRLLEADGLGRPRLVVLSACETGLHDLRGIPDEFIGLPVTFTALGAAGVLSTLWPVSDAATALLMAKFYELHMGDRLPPPTALRKAQLWLRHATNVDLADYASVAAKQGRLETRHVAEIEQELSEAALARSRNAAAIDWITPSGETQAVGKKTSSNARRLARPYAHPYFWAGFIYTGL